MICKAKFKINNSKEYYCEITEELDKICEYASDGFRNYILDTRDVWENSIAIRVPGRTTGCIRIDNNNIIISCIIDDECCGKYYPTDVNEILKKYIGVKLELN